MQQMFGDLEKARGKVNRLELQKVLCKCGMENGRAEWNGKAEFFKCGNKGK